MKTKPIKKAYKIDIGRIYDGAFMSDKYCYAENLSKAKSELLKQIKYDDLEDNFGEKITFLNIPVLRLPTYDIFDFEGEQLPQYRIAEIQAERKRWAKLDELLADPDKKYCYIQKGGSYYAPGSAGYESRKRDAGIYTIQEGVTSAKGCEDIYLETVSAKDHNEMILKAIADLTDRLITKEN